MICETFDGQKINSQHFAKQLGELIFNGIRTKFTAKLFSEATAKSISFVLAQVLSSESSKNLIIARQDDALCGCLFLTTTDNRSLYDVIKQEYSGLMKFKVLLFFAILEHKLAINETYIEFLVVSERYRKKGVGTQLIKQCQNNVSTKILTLYVASNNTNAINLYQKNSFHMQITQNSLLTSKLINNKKWHFMVWENTK
ncbi:GNAT family N-acetyltransferase [Leuconostoc gelidum]|uniref:GNAT family N-acetyltransferase n=1 Tax=Leuconostoc gelidum TaxID=1244 RepID=UPI001C7DF7D0|nr:GNAT family N-acetyltransferase [Leuconostoc gelidum]MBZ6009788.1 GNAT family N-acetyltransferase [Leuconostoc gelidum subsp. aenigmaticum]